MTTHQGLGGYSDEEFLQRMVQSYPERFKETLLGFLPPRWRHICICRRRPWPPISAVAQGSSCGIWGNATHRCVSMGMTSPRRWSLMLSTCQPQALDRRLPA